MSAQPFLLPTSFNGEVRLFPLPDVVMFPGNVLPLHIFESRYREMLEDAIQGDQLISIATLQPGYEPDYYSRPPLAPVVCVGQVTAHEKNEQGTYNLLLVGLQRARIEHEIEPVRSFRRAAVTVLMDCSEKSEESARIKVARDLASRIRQTVPAAENIVGEFDKGSMSLASFVDIFAFHLPLDVTLKLELLSELDVLKRARKLLGALPKPEDNRSPTSHRRNFSEN